MRQGEPGDKAKGAPDTTPHLEAMFLIFAIKFKHMRVGIIATPINFSLVTKGLNLEGVVR